MHLGLVFALVALALFAVVMRRTRWGLEIRAIGGNQDAARRSGIPVARYVVILMFAGGAFAGLAGTYEKHDWQANIRPVVELKAPIHPNELCETESCSQPAVFMQDFQAFGRNCPLA